jgi:hypothetical protein
MSTKTAVHAESAGALHLELAHVAREGETEPTRDGRPLTEADAIEIWIARWLRIRRKDLVARYGCDSRRLYEIWWGERFPSSKAKAEALFRARHPTLVDRTSFGYRRIPRTATIEPERQLSLFGAR